MANTQERSESFWSHYNRLPHPVVRLVRDVPVHEVVEFARGVGAITHLVAQRRNDVIFIPERGAGPISWAMQQWNEFDGSETHFSYLPIGTHTTVTDYKQGGYSHTTKKYIIELEVRRQLELRGAINRPLLIDEVQTGGTLFSAAKNLQEVLKRLQASDVLDVVAIQDNREHSLYREKVPGFIRMVTHEDARFQAATVPLPLFFLDKQSMLNHILEPNDIEDESRKLSLLRIVHNAEAVQLIKDLVLCVKQPELLKRAIDQVMIVGNISLDDVPSVDNQRYVSRLKDLVEEAVTDPGLTRDEGLVWLNDLYSVSNEVIER